jgi:hypothetical protein
MRFSLSNTRDGEASVTHIVTLESDYERRANSVLLLELKLL